MTVLALVLLLLAAASPLLALALRRSPRDPIVALAFLAALLLAGAAVFAAYADPASGWRRGAALVLGVAAATTAGSDVVRATFRVIRGEYLALRRPRPSAVDVEDNIDDDVPGSVLRGGAWV